MLLPLLHLLCEPPGALLRELVVTRPAIVFALFPLSLDHLPIPFDGGLDTTSPLLPEADGRMRQGRGR